MHSLGDEVVRRHHDPERQIVVSLRAQSEAMTDAGLDPAADLGPAHAAFAALADELESHMAKEEHILFPAIRDLANARRQAGQDGGVPFGTLLHPIRAMENEHAHATRLLEDIAGARRTTTILRPAADGAGRDLDRLDEDLTAHPPSRTKNSSRARWNSNGACRSGRLAYHLPVSAPPDDDMLRRIALFRRLRRTPAPGSRRWRTCEATSAAT